MPPLAIDVMEAHRAALLRADDAAMRAMAQRWLQIEQALQAQLDALILEILQQGGGPLTMWQLVRLRRYQTLLEQLNLQAAQFVDYVTQDITTRQRTAGMEAIDQSSLAISAAAADAGIQLQFDRLPVTNVERMVGLAGDGSPLRTILQSASTTGADALAQQLIQGVALGLNPREIARRAMRQGLATSFTRMVTIARTEVLRVARQTTLENYRHSKAVRAYRRVASKSQRTCIACLALDGEIYPLTTPFEEHVNGRCVPVPVLIRGTPLEYENGKDWFARQPEATQRQMMGPGRFDLWQSGDVTWNDLVRIHEDETWGNSPQVRPVRELEQRAGRQAVRPQRQRAPRPPQTPAAPAAPLLPTPVANVNKYVPFNNYRDANDWAEKAYAEFDASLTPKDTKVIDLYCGPGSRYREWNAALRSGAALDRMLQYATNELDAIINRASPGRNIVTYRGTRNVFPTDYTELQKLVGTIVTDKGYVSTSFNQSRAFDFGGAQDAIMEIRIPGTAKAAYLNPSESEVVLPRNTRFKVVEVRLDQDDPEEPPWKVIVLEVLE